MTTATHWKYQPWNRARNGLVVVTTDGDQGRLLESTDDTIEREIAAFSRDWLQRQFSNRTLVEYVRFVRR